MSRCLETCWRARWTRARSAGAPGLDALARSFAERNPGSSIDFLPAARPTRRRRPSGGVRPAGPAGRGRWCGSLETTPLRVGDLLPLKPGGRWSSTGPSISSCSIAEPLASTVPSVIRPDFDPALTDSPGGCATDPGACRAPPHLGPAAGPYVNRGFNCRRVRIDGFHALPPGRRRLGRDLSRPGAPLGRELLVCRDCRVSTAKSSTRRVIASARTTSTALRVDPAPCRLPRPAAAWSRPSRSRRCGRAGDRGAGLQARMRDPARSSISG